jgi:TctA family transporter
MKKKRIIKNIFAMVLILVLSSLLGFVTFDGEASIIETEIVISDENGHSHSCDV